MNGQSDLRPRRFLLALLLGVVVLTTGCETTPRDTGPNLIEQYQTRSILILPPIDNTLEVDASYQYLPTVSRPVAERGFYVFPVAVVDRLMRENGLPGPAEMHTVGLGKLGEVFGADAVLYLSLDNWGVSYRVLDSSTRVTVNARLVDTRTGTELWRGRQTAVHSSSSSNQSGLVGLLVGAVINQIGSSINDISPQVARQANAMLFGTNNGASVSKGTMPVGPYRLAAEKEAAAAGKGVALQPSSTASSPTRPRQ